MALTYDDYKKLYSNDTGDPVDATVQQTKSTQATTATSNTTATGNSSTASRADAGTAVNKWMISDEGSGNGYTVSGAATPEVPLTQQQKMDNTQSKMDELYDQIMNYGSYSYDMNSDALYQMYKDQYIANGQRAMQDTMGQAAGLTGGYGSTYAESAAQQSYNNYLQQLNAMVPELEQNAYSRWSNGLSQLQNQYSMTGDYYNQLYAQQQADYAKLMTNLQNKILPSEDDMIAAGFSAEEIAYWQKKLGKKKTTNKKASTSTSASEKLASDIAASYKNGLALDSSTLDGIISANASNKDYTGATSSEVKKSLQDTYGWTYSRK